MSDISGQDIRSHENVPAKAISHIRDWLNTASGRRTIPGGAAINRRYQQFQEELPEICDRLYQGLKAFGQIIKSQFILRYLDDVELRQAIERQLNKVESANRFTRAVAVGNPREFTQGEKEEQEIAEACNRLIKNSIICWNYLYLSDKLARLEKQPEQQKILLAAIASHSVMSWAHINMLGEYDFSDEKLQDSFGIRPPKLVK